MDKVLQLFNLQKWDHLKYELNLLCELKKDGNSTRSLPIKLPQDFLKTCLYMLQSLKDRIEDDEEVCATIFRCLRSSVVQNAIQPSEIPDGLALLHLSKEYLELYSNLKDRERCGTYLRPCLNFIVNVTVSNKNMCSSIWDIYSEKIIMLLQNGTETYLVSAIIYNILLQTNEPIKIEKSYFKYLVAGLCSEQNEYFIFIIEKLISSIEFSNFVKCLDESSMFTLVSFVKEELDVSHLNSDSGFETIIQQFQTLSDCILNSKLTNLLPLEYMLYSNLIAKISSTTSFLEILQNNKCLVISTIFLLKCLHNTPKQNSEESTQLSIGLKSNLVRILGNLCYLHKNNQHLILEHDVVPIILECCQIKDDEPFMMQWAIFAIRNICEDNNDIKNLLSSMTKRKVINSSTLEKMGITLEDTENGGIKIAPISAFKDKTDSL